MGRPLPPLMNILSSKIKVIYEVLTFSPYMMQVRLIGYCVEGSLFLVYEYIENGNLSQHLHGSGELR